MLNNKNFPRILFSESSFLNFSVWIAFLFCFIYWIYLLCTSKMSIVYDAMEFERFGRMLYHSGWIEFFKTGPHNEPVFPLLIAFSMRVADCFSISYQTVQTCLHILILFSTQLLTLFILKQMRICESIKAIIVLYIGISPALVNATFSLLSEIATYPFILAIILISIKSWELILSGQRKKIILWGIYLAIIFIIIASIKALFEYIFIVFMLPYLWLMIKSLIKKERKVFIAAFGFLLTTVCLFNAYLFFYKSLNQKYNGHFMFTDRGPYILYGNAAKRSEPLNFRRFAAGLAFIPGDGVCYKLFAKEDCDFWHIFTVERYGRPKLRELESKGVPNSEIDSMLINLAKEKILEKPFQQTVLIFLESFKMFFWESTAGFVLYPLWLQRLFQFVPFKNGLRLVVFLITFFATLYTLSYILRNKSQLFHPQNVQMHLLFFILVLFLSYTGLYSLFIINTRYASPIASLYLIMIAFTIQNMMFKQKLETQ